MFDTVIFVRALLNPRSVWGKVIFEYYPHYSLFVSPQVLLEILEVLKRPEISKKYRFVEGMDIKRVLEILQNADVIKVKTIPAVSKDPKDDKFLATAKAASADYLISADKDLLDLKVYEGIKIIDAETFLKLLVS